MSSTKATFLEICNMHNIRPESDCSIREYRTLRNICDSKVLKNLCPGWWKTGISGRVLSEFSCKPREILTDEQVAARLAKNRERNQRARDAMTPEKRAEEALKRKERNRKQREREAEANRLALARVKEL